MSRRWLRQVAELMERSDLECVEGAESEGSSHRQIPFQVEARDDAVVELLLGSEPIEDERLMATQHLRDVFLRFSSTFIRPVSPDRLARKKATSYRPQAKAKAECPLSLGLFAPQCYHFDGRGGSALKRLITAVLTVLLTLGLYFCSPGQQSDDIDPAEMPKAKTGWSVGIYSGETPFSLSSPEGVSNPVLRASDVTDFNADIVAHPFMAVTDSHYYLFCTVKFGETDEGGIGLAQSENGLDWEYQQLVIKEPFVLSYPYVFKWQDNYYMIPEAHTETSVRLYRATDFPLKWTYEKDLISGDTFISASVVNYQGTWWMFVSPKGNNTLRLFSASELTGSWTEHPMSPIVADNPDTARPGGRLIVYQDSLYRMGQDCHPRYGNQLHAFEITEISPTSYRERMIEPPLVKASSTGWNGEAMHHVDLHQTGEGTWIAAVDALGVVP